jgi:hypothetical protein
MLALLGYGENPKQTTGTHFVPARNFPYCKGMRAFKNECVARISTEDASVPASVKGSSDSCPTYTGFRVKIS